MTVELRGYDIDPQRGFLPDQSPLECLPSEFSAWDDIGRELPKILMTNAVRARIEALPPLDATTLVEPRAVRRAMMILSYLGHAYVWGTAEPATSIPCCLSRPWHQLASALGRPPVLSYASYALDNWRTPDRAGAIELGNIALLQNFLGGQDEEWFVLVHVAIEAKAGPALAAITASQQAVAADEPEAVAEQLAIVAATLEVLHATLLRMPERCDPYIYFRRVRPYLHGWSDHPSLPDGVRYEGVAEYGGTGQKFRGETGAQSSILPTCDAALGIAHADDPLRHYLKQMLDYMPPRHRAFIAAIEQGPSVRDYVRRRGRALRPLREAYNSAVAGVARFRTTHLHYAHRYIIKQSQISRTNPNQVGTGGTPFGPYLKKHRDETRRHRLAAGK